MRGILTQPVRLARVVRPPPLSAPVRLAPRPSPTGPSVLQHIPKRGFSSGGPKRSRYDRWDPYGGQGQPGSGRQNVENYVKRRLGGDRGVKIYAIGIGAALIYYVCQ